MTDRPLVIWGSARKQGETRNFINKVFAGIDYKLIDLLDFYISPYDYSNNYSNRDDFLKIADKLLNIILLSLRPLFIGMQ